ncbi:6-phosphogluconate dehydrogenase, decarboxylating [bioreactor metagenome]|uniref:phosphogluconate dehydrogenase (NADP(+)-dependent, decarboxylating) n=1 Tax=bioreactor metagenome TaxID=1076179 RepID=A0A644UQD6_9ZZZZ
MEKSDIGLIGLAVMGENLVLNMESKGFKVSVYNRTFETTDKFIKGRASGKKIEGFQSMESLVLSLKLPRKIMLMVRAGSAVDSVIEQLIPLLSPGDILIDGGNSNFKDSERRESYLAHKGLLFVGSGVSGGEEGALKGPSVMPGGAEEAWSHIKPIFTSIAAVAEDGEPCCAWTGSGGAGHFVKMVHNGIEYGDMQLISEAYSVMKSMMGMSNEEISKVFDEWNRGKLQSYLIEITANILKHKDSDGGFLLDYILDAAGQKGTGKWSVESAMDYGVPLNLIATSVFERSLSSSKDLRIEASNHYSIDKISDSALVPSLDEIRDALFASKLVSYAQGFDLMKKVSDEKSWNLDLSSIAKIWRNGCIIRSTFLNDIAKSYYAGQEHKSLLLSNFFTTELKLALKGWKSLVSKASLYGTSLPAFSSALNYFYSFTSENLPANLIQAQRDYFGAHTFERKDSPRGVFFHENWTGEGGETKSGVYNA